MISPVEVYLVYDLETTGLSAEKHAICEIAICPISKELNDLPEYSSGIIKPYGDREITDGALAHNGITREQLASGRDIKEVFQELHQYLKSLKAVASKIVLCGHNIDSFDNPFLEDFFRLNKKDLYKYVSGKITLDTMWWGRMGWLESANYKLSTCCSNAKIELVDAHRAITDTRANKELVKYFLRNLRGEGQSTAKEERFRKSFQF